MKFFKILLCSSLLITLIACNLKQEKLTHDIESYKTVLEIKYGNKKEDRTTEVISERQLTAMEAIQSVAIVETHPIGKYVFVSSIDSVHTVRGKMAWYYKVNGKAPGVLAINNQLNNGDTLTWIYKTDVCSKTVDEKTCCAK